MQTHQGPMAIRNIEILYGNRAKSCCKCYLLKVTSNPLIRKQGRQVPSLTPQEARKTVAFDKSAAKRLTPTIKSFTLEKKVAVVTG